MANIRGFFSFLCTSRMTYIGMQYAQMVDETSGVFRWFSRRTFRHRRVVAFPAMDGILPPLSPSISPSRNGMAAWNGSVRFGWFIMRHGVCDLPGNGHLTLLLWFCLSISCTFSLFHPIHPFRFWCGPSLFLLLSCSPRFPCLLPTNLPVSVRFGRLSGYDTIVCKIAMRCDAPGSGLDLRNRDGRNRMDAIFSEFVFPFPSVDFGVYVVRSGRMCGIDERVLLMVGSRGVALVGCVWCVCVCVCCVFLGYFGVRYWRWDGMGWENLPRLAYQSACLPACLPVACCCMS
ncbi:hypothetical protein P152DRAFT_261490 [Eremomyces bilateralis CBS 781.70]|uniref:Uncharacterized protein n=1 Tax=Eremomyces bilateralis CBS 781.70 TaxID=1392243 RepID=A0A6G1G887_9PEZI|nr:uncharacterized protein P152DRAFT_261490 [Eremomyces bilateralis CBS 781.70]KAF1814110.1 hypothetical protein P152DRAFT_261490 [Eremomyces bilateralis CBS 781.70]